MLSTCHNDCEVVCFFKYDLKDLLSDMPKDKYLRSITVLYRQHMISNITVVPVIRNFVLKDELAYAKQGESATLSKLAIVPFDDSYIRYRWVVDQDGSLDNATSVINQDVFRYSKPVRKGHGKTMYTYLKGIFAYNKFSLYEQPMADCGPYFRDHLWYIRYGATSNGTFMA